MLGAIILGDRRNNGPPWSTLYQHTLRNVRTYAQLVSRFNTRC